MLFDVQTKHEFVTDVTNLANYLQTATCVSVRLGNIAERSAGGEELLVVNLGVSYLDGADRTFTIELVRKKLSKTKGIYRIRVTNISEFLSGYTIGEPAGIEVEKDPSKGWIRWVMEYLANVHTVYR